MCTCLREGIAATQIAKVYNDKKGHNSSNLGYFMAVDTGGQCTVSGSGQMFENFLATGKLENFTGCGEIPVKFYEENFENVPYCVMKFDQTFDKMPYNCRTSKLPHIAIFHNTRVNALC